MMLSPRRQTFDLNLGMVNGEESKSNTTKSNNHHQISSNSNNKLGNGIFLANSSSSSSSSSLSNSRSRSNSSSITFSEPTKDEEQQQQPQRMPYRDRKLSESVVSLTHVLEEEENIPTSILMQGGGVGNGGLMEDESRTSITNNQFNSSASPFMARSTSQRRISQEINLHSPRTPGFNQQSSSKNEGISSTTPQRVQSPNGINIARRNSARGSNGGIPINRNYPTRSMSTGGGGIPMSNGISSSSSSSSTNLINNNKNDGYFSVGSDDGFSEIASSSSTAATAAAAIAVPFPRSFSSSQPFTSDSPSARRIGRHLSLSGAQSSESVNIEPLSPRFADLLPATPRSSVGGNGNGIGGSRKSHIRYSSDLHIARPNFTTSKSEASFDHSSRSRRSSEVGSLYANTLDDSNSLSGVKLMGRDPSIVKPSKHRLILTEEGKSDVTLQLGNCIGRGQFGSVYRALNLNTGQMVAVKRIKLNNRSEDEVTQLMHEVELLKSLVHPSVVKYEGLVRGEDVVSIVLEYVENGSLLHTLKAFGNFPEKLVASYVVKILEGLQYLHEMKVVHCDLKAANILTTKNGNVKLSDFGVSLNLKAAEDLKKNDAIGTPNWMAPEVIELKGASTAADIWSLGCTIIELLTGKPPYGDMLAMSAMWRIVEDDCPPLPKDISDSLFDFLSQCFQKDPDLRPSASTLNEHAWLKTTWSDHKALRSQDSVPFFKRVASGEQRKGSVRKTLPTTSEINGSLERKGVVGRTRQATVTQADILTSLPARNSEPMSIGASETITNVMERSTSSPSTNSASLRPHLLAMRAVSAPDAWSVVPKPISESEQEESRSNTPLYSPTGASTALSISPPSMIPSEAMARRGSDVTSTNTSLDILRSPNTLVGIEKERVIVNGLEGIPLDNSVLDLSSPSTTDVFMLDEQASMNKSHAFVKSSFSKPVLCKICRESVKKHAILCEECGLICHASCAKRAITPCNLRAQLLMMANHRSSMDVTRVLSPSPSTNSPPPATPTSNSGTPIFRFPFGKYKRNSKAGVSDLNLPSTEFSSSPQTTIVDSDLSVGINSKSPPLTPMSPKDLTPTPAIGIIDDGNNKRQKRTRRISLLPSHLMRQRSHSPSPTPSQSQIPSKPIIISTKTERSSSVPQPHSETSTNVTANDSINEGTGMVRSPSSTHSNHDDSVGYGSSASSMSSSFHLGSPTSQMSSTGRSQFPSIEIRNIHDQSVQFATGINKKQQSGGEIPISRNERRQRHLSASAAALSIGSTPNLLQRGNSNQGSGNGVTRPILPIRQTSQGIPWSRNRFDSSSGLSSNESILTSAGNSNEHSMGAAALVLASKNKVGNGMGGGKGGNGMGGHSSTNQHHIIEGSNSTNQMIFNDIRNEKRHHRRLSSKQDCIIA